MAPKLALAPVALAVALASQTARAEAPSLDARTFRPATDPRGGLSLEPADVMPAWSFAATSLVHYSYRPVTVCRADTGDVFARPIEHVVGGDFGFAFAIPNVQLGASLPYVFAQTGDKGLPGAVSSTARAPLAAIGDLALEAKSPILTYTTAGLGVGLRGRVTLPTGERTSFAGSGTTSVDLRILAEYNLLVVTAHASLGYLTRFDRTEWPLGSGTLVGDELPWAVGFRVKPKLTGLDTDDRHMVELAFRGSLPAGPTGPFTSGAAPLSPVLFGVSDRIGLGDTRDVAVMGGVDVGVTDAIGVPAFRVIGGLAWTPAEHDQDHDGVRDDRDQCPEIAEDRDGFEDDDGCPDIDNDDDGVLDKEDACPSQAGVEQPAPRNGCPAPDDDKDGVPNSADACPSEPGPASEDPRLAGCPRVDTDQDGIPDPIDRCPKEPEDKDGYADEDGCPDPDDDGDGVLDRVDACPKERGEPSSDPTKNGCPIHDRDGDTFEDAVDQCPDAPENFNGVKDDDGCPDTGGAPLVTIAPVPVAGRALPAKAPRSVLRLARPVKVVPSGAEWSVDEASVVVLRAVALELSRHRELTLTVGAKPKTAGDADVADAEKRARAVALRVRELTRRESSAEIVAWDAVKDATLAGASGIGLGVVASEEPPAATPAATPTAAPAPAPAPAPQPATPKKP